MFFNGGINQNFSGRAATTPGVNGRGVWTPGVNATWYFADHVFVQGTAAYLSAFGANPAASSASQPAGGKVYGVEADAVLGWEALDWLTARVASAVLFPGDFFADGSPTPWQVVLGLDLVNRTGAPLGSVARP